MDEATDMLTVRRAGTERRALLSTDAVRPVRGRVGWDRDGVFRRDGTTRTESCEVYFGWVLEGRAIQDVWIAPARKDRTEPGRDGSKDMYGTTIRVYDPGNDNWQITWIDPDTQGYGRMTGRQVGDDIVQEYREDDGSLWGWRFTEIGHDSFRWLARESNGMAARRGSSGTSSS